MQKDVVWQQKVVSDFLNDLLSDFQKLREISRELVFNIAYLCLLLIFIATSSTSLSRGIYTLLAFIDLGFSIPIIHSLETLKIQEALWAVVQSEHCIRHSHIKCFLEQYLKLAPSWTMDRAFLSPVCKINVFIPYRCLTWALQLLSLDCTGSQCLATLTIYWTA